MAKENMSRTYVVCRQPCKNDANEQTADKLGLSCRAQDKNGLTSRKQFLVFIKVLLDYLQQHAPELKSRVKQVTSECIQRHRDGDPQCAKLPVYLRQRLHEIVGEWHWSRVMLIVLYAQQTCKMGRPSSWKAEGVSQLPLLDAARELSIHTATTRALYHTQLTLFLWARVLSTLPCFLCGARFANSGIWNCQLTTARPNC
mmetsp:Transcript_12143/g.28093  ORF Transcript_12143/g.28093 Transcript_12143/m.28093 type:complete len:200 (-) Transcript_12143:501-1100(-)